jgi:hypothetical protein
MEPKGSLLCSQEPTTGPLSPARSTNVGVNINLPITSISVLQSSYQNSVCISLPHPPMHNLQYAMATLSPFLSSPLMWLKQESHIFISIICIDGAWKFYLPFNRSIMKHERLFHVLIFHCLKCYVRLCKYSCFKLYLTKWHFYDH